MKKALIVIDAQNDFITGALANPAAQAALPSLVNLITNFDEDGEIYLTQDTHYSSDYMDSLEGQMLPVPHCIDGTEGWQICPEVAELFEEMDPFTKPSFGSFSLIRQIINDYRDEEIEFHVCGFCTDICIITNTLMLRSAFPNSHIYVHANACAGTTPEKHEAALEVMRSCQIEIIKE